MFDARGRGAIRFIDVAHQESTVPKSRVRQKKVYTPPTDVVPRVTRISRKQSGIWLPITAVSLIVGGIAWLVMFYLSQGALPVLSWRYWNLAIGFGAMVSALVLFARWR
jgi:Cell division protein CrgA